MKNRDFAIFTLNNDKKRIKSLAADLSLRLFAKKEGEIMGNTDKKPPEKTSERKENKCNKHRLLTNVKSILPTNQQ